MGSSDLVQALSKAYKGDAPATATVELNPYLAIVSAILYMMVVDGDISESETSQLQAVIGADQSTLHQAVSYIRSHSLEEFLVAAPPLLDDRTRLCLLLNVCDSLMADGKLLESELVLLRQMLGAFGQTQASFQPYYDSISAKTNTAVLGDFNIVPPAGSMTPAMALVVSLLYMMSADGSMAEEEIGRLQTVAVISPNLLKSSLRYVSQISSQKFLASVTGSLNEAQRLCIVLNACDTMMADRLVAKEEHQLFRRMLSAFEMDPQKIAGHLNVIGLKNEMPEPPRATSPSEARLPQPANHGRSREEGIIFDRKHTYEEKTGDAGKSALATTQSTAMRSVPNDAAGLESMILHSMQDNIDVIRGQLNDDVSVETMQRNARSEEPGGQLSEHDDGISDLRSLRDGDGSASSKTGSSDGPSDLRSVYDGESSASSKTVSSEGPSDPRSLLDAEGSVTSKTGSSEGPSDPRAYQDSGETDHRLHEDGSEAQPGRYLQDADMPGKRREMSDTNAPQSDRNLIDNRKSFDDEPDDLDQGPWLENELCDRVMAISDRTRTIHSYLEALLSAKSIAAASRLPTLPLLPIEPRNYPLQTPAQISEEAPLTIKEWVETQPMLFESNSGGPIMSQNQPPETKEDAAQNRRLRRWSASLLPALFLTYGTTLVGESVAERAFITHQNLATDARTVHQMTTVQQSVYRVNPNAVSLSAENLQAGLALSTSSAMTSTAGLNVAEAGAGVKSQIDAAQISDREKADKFLEQRKQELVALSQQHQSAGAIAAERQQWFAYAQSIILLGLGMAFWGVLYRSMTMLHASTAAGIAGLLMTANGYWLFVQI